MLKLPDYAFKMPSTYATFKTLPSFFQGIAKCLIDNFRNSFNVFTHRFCKSTTAKIDNIDLESVSSALNSHDTTRAERANEKSMNLENSLPFVKTSRYCKLFQPSLTTSSCWHERNCALKTTKMLNMPAKFELSRHFFDNFDFVVCNKTHLEQTQIELAHSTLHKPILRLINRHCNCVRDFRNYHWFASLNTGTCKNKKVGNSGKTINKQRPLKWVHIAVFDLHSSN